MIARGRHRLAASPVRARSGGSPRRLAVTVGATLVAAAALGACGSSPTALTRTQLISRADAVCLKVNRQAAAAVAALPRATGSDAARLDFIRATEATLPLSDRGLAQLRALAAPSELGADWRRFLHDVQVEDQGEHQLVQAARSGDLRRGESTQVTMQGAAADLQQVTTRDGFSVCGRPPAQ